LQSAQMPIRYGTGAPTKGRRSAGARQSVEHYEDVVEASVKRTRVSRSLPLRFRAKTRGQPS
jgi:hypothetical protein